MPGWGSTEYILLIVLAPLLVGSAFFSGSETALFGMSESQRLQCRHEGTLAARAIEALLADQRMLLITILLGNMLMNVLFFVISSVLILHAESALWLSGVMSLAPLLVVILMGEVLPKMVADAWRMRSARLTAPMLLLIHGAVGPLRVVINTIVVAPLSRLTAPSTAPPELDADELRALLELSGRQGVIDSTEQRLLRDVLEVGRLIVRDIMTPRVKMASIARDAPRDEVLAVAKESRLTRLPRHEGDLDTIIGVLHLKQYLLDQRPHEQAVEQATRPARFVPEVATLEQLLGHFRATGTQSAIVVDEFGGTAGVVSVEDVAEELVGDIVSHDEDQIEAPQSVARNTWRVDGGMSVHDWAEAFGEHLVSPRVSTLGGLVLERLGRAPAVGDVVQLGNVQIRVDEIDRARVVRAIVTLRPGAGPEAAP